MRKFKSLIAVLAITVTSAALFTGCRNTGSNDSNSSSQLQAELKQTQYPVTITTYDASGNEVEQTFEKAPERIVTNNLSATETLIELGLGDKIVGMMNPDNEVTSVYKDSIANINKLGDKKTISKEIVLSAMPDIIVGRTAMFSDKSLGEYTEWNANGVEVYAQAASVTKGETKIESVIQDVKNLKDFVMQVLRERRRLNLGKLPIYLSEWNNTPSQQDLLNDTCFKSCYIVKNILENYDRLESFTYQALTDLMADSSLPNMLFFGGLGLFTVNGIPKASYYAYTLLQQLGDQFLGRGDEYFITRENDSFQVMLYNYRHFNYLYANGERFDMTETDRYTVFADSEPVMISLCLSDIPQGNYKISETYVNRTHGSAFDQWVSMGALELTTPQEIDWLKKSSVPGFHQKIVSVNSDEILELDVTLELLEVRLIQITPLH